MRATGYNMAAMYAYYVRVRVYVCAHVEVVHISFGMHYLVYACTHSDLFIDMGRSVCALYIGTLYMCDPLSHD